jgi:hypothetical protein
LNKKLVLSLSAFVILVAVAIGYWQWTKSPTYSLKQLASAIKDHDRDDVEKYLDIESVASGVMDQFFAQMPKDPTANNQWAAAGQMIASGFLEMMKPKLAAMAKDKFLNYVESGKFQDSPPNETGPAANLTNTLKTTTTQMEFKGIKSVKKEGKIALVILTVVGADKREV